MKNNLLRLWILCLALILSASFSTISNAQKPFPRKRPSGTSDRQRPALPIVTENSKTWQNFGPFFRVSPDRSSPPLRLDSSRTIKEVQFSWSDFNGDTVAFILFDFQTVSELPGKKIGDKPFVSWTPNRKASEMKIMIEDGGIKLNSAKVLYGNGEESLASPSEIILANIEEESSAPVPEEFRTHYTRTSGKCKVAWSGGGPRAMVDFEYFRELNITQAETNAMWRFIERNKGRYDFSGVRRVVSGMKQAGVKEISLSIVPENPAYINVVSSKKTIAQTDSQWQAYGSFLKALVREFKDDVQIYQIVRELNPGRFVGTSRDYAKLLRFSSDTIKQIDPDAQIAFGALAYEMRVRTGRNNFITEVIKALPNDKKYFDFIDIHMHKLGASDGGPLTHSNGATQIARAFDFYKNQLRGTIYEDVHVLFETSSYTSRTGQIRGLPEHSEENQGNDIRNRLDILNQKGAYWINLEGGIIQRAYFFFSPGGGSKKSPVVDYFENCGLIWNPKVNDGKSGKKKAFYLVKEWNNRTD